jgi:hypothetical protein
MYINNTNLLDFGGNLRMEYTYTPPTISNDYFKGRKRSTFILLNSNFELGTLSCPVVFEGKNREDVTAQKSAFEQIAFGSCDIDMEDGYSYFAFLDSIGEASYPSESLIEVDYTFQCIRHGQYETSVGNSVFCKSTLPNTDCILSVTVGSAGSNYVVGTVTFPTVTQGQQIVVDGINKRILVNGAPAADQAEWTVFPYLVPGENNLTCDDTMTVEYYPVYF